MAQFWGCRIDFNTRFADKSCVTSTVQMVFEEARTLLEDSRVALAERLVESVAPATQVVAEQMEVARRRSADLEAGRVQPVPGPEGLNRVREALLKRAAS